MGNHISCVSPAALKRLHATSDCSSQDLVKLLHCETGTVSELDGPLTAAEVMMEFPGHFLSCFSNALSSGRRICAVPADEGLRTAELYLLLPMHKLNTRFSGEDMAFCATLTTKDSGKKPSRGAILQSKVAPFPASVLSSLQSSNAENLVRHSMRSLSFKQLDSMDLQGPAAPPYTMGAAKNVMCRSKSWIPKLETIRESIAV